MATFHENLKQSFKNFKNKYIGNVPSGVTLAQINADLTDKVSGFTDTTYSAVTGLAYDNTNKKLGLKVGADTVIPFSGKPELLSDVSLGGNNVTYTFPSDGIIVGNLNPSAYSASVTATIDGDTYTAYKGGSGVHVLKYVSKGGIYSSNAGGYASFTYIQFAE